MKLSERRKNDAHPLLPSNTRSDFQHLRTTLYQIMRQYNFKKRRQNSWHLQRAAKEIRVPRDCGYVEIDHATCTDVLTFKMVKKKFKVFAEEFHEYSRPETNDMIERIAQEYDRGIGPVVRQARDKTGRPRLNADAEEELRKQFTILAIREKSLGDTMVKILSFGACWSITPGKERFFPLLNRCAVRGILYL